MVQIKRRRSKLTAKAVREIRADKVSKLRELAARYGVSLEAIHDAKVGRTWKDI
jgi:Holliday junction resolvase-like predicted endonuclease